MCNIAGTPYGDVEAFGREHAADGLIVYLEVAGDEAPTICRNLHGLRLAGWFDHARAILIGRTRAPAHPSCPNARPSSTPSGGLRSRSSSTWRSATSAPPAAGRRSLATLTVDGDVHEIVQQLDLTGATSGSDAARPTQVAFC